MRNLCGICTPRSRPRKAIARTDSDSLPSFGKQVNCRRARMSGSVRSERRAVLQALKCGPECPLASKKSAESAPHLAQGRNVVGDHSAPAKSGLKRSEPERLIDRGADINCAVVGKDERTSVSDNSPRTFIAGEFRGSADGIRVRSSPLQEWAWASRIVREDARFFASSQKRPAVTA